MLNRFEDAHSLLAEALTFDVPPSTSLLIHASSFWQLVHTKKPERAVEHAGRIFQWMEEGIGFGDPLAFNIILWSVAFPGYLSRIENLSALVRAGNLTGFGEVCAHTSPPTSTCTAATLTRWTPS